MTAYFVTATGTEMGKTYISTQILRAARASQRTVQAIKPLMSGFQPDDLNSSDAGHLLAAMGACVNAAAIDAIVAHRFAAHMAPNVAARRAGVELDYAHLLAFTRQRLGQADVTLVEGAGGLMSPLTDNHLHTDMMVALGLPVILVCGQYLGTISHTLTALKVLASYNIAVAAIAVSQPRPTAGEPDMLLPELARWTNAPCFSVPYGSSAAALATHLLRQKSGAQGRI